MSDTNHEAELSDADLEQAAGGIIGDCTGGTFPTKPVLGGPIVGEPTPPICELPGDGFPIRTATS